MKVRTQSKKVNKAWLNDHVNDPYVKRAQQEGYRSRAAFKLKEIDDAFGLVRPGMTIVDLGSAPGAWSQYLRRRLAPQGAATGALDGRIVALDLLPMEAVDGVHFVQGDFRDDATLQALRAALGDAPVDLVVSDMAPNLSGVASVDAARIQHLFELALAFCAERLRPGGAFALKLFHGSGYSQCIEALKRQFAVVKPVKPAASRSRSAETFVVAMGHKP